jgi:hypothetical protein
MSGIINYFHGETGVVADRWWQLLNTKVALCVELAENPHRVVARDYNGDISIDPLIVNGNDVVYLRLDDTCGMWVRECDQYGRGWDAALARVLENRRKWMERWNEHDADAAVALAKELFEETGDPIRIVIGEPEPLGERPSTDVGFFLSYSSRDALLARQIYEDLRTDGKASVWFDMAQPADSGRQHEEAIREWLKISVELCKGFILLLTRTALESTWVQQEIGFARELQRHHPDFRILALKVNDVPIPDSVQAAVKVIDCNGIWWSNGLNEELFAALYNREGRRAWLDKSGSRASAGSVLTYADFATDSGEITRFSWQATPGVPSSSFKKEISWSLQYRRSDGAVLTVDGRGKDQPVDLDMTVGCRAAFLVVRRRFGSHLYPGVPLWMRSKDLSLTSDSVLNRYYDALEPKQAEPAAVADPSLAHHGPSRAYELSLRLVEEGWAYVVNYRSRRA